jgi:hypothetical protein
MDKLVCFRHVRKREFFRIELQALVAHLLPQFRSQRDIPQQYGFGQRSRPVEVGAGRFATFAGKNPLLPVTGRGFEIGLRPIFFLFSVFMGK